MIYKRNAQTFVRKYIDKKEHVFYTYIYKNKDPSSNGAPTPSDRSYTYTQIQSHFCIEFEHAELRLLLFYIFKIYKSSNFKQFCKISK